MEAYEPNVQDNRLHQIRLKSVDKVGLAEIVPHLGNQNVGVIFAGSDTWEKNGVGVVETKPKSNYPMVHKAVETCCFE